MRRLFNVAPWTQFFDLKSHTAPTRKVNSITIRNVSGEFLTLGILRGNPGDTLRENTLENIDLKLADQCFELGDVKNFVLKNFQVNKAPYQVPASKD